MGYSATVLKIMLASPADVLKERQVARSIISDWNVVNAEDRRIVLLPIGWETHASPQMGDRPQAIINRQMLKDCDILVAVFWTRLGSPTGTAQSGTVEEIEEHVAKGKPALIYFSSTPVRPDSVDNDQYSALLEFKESCRQRGLVEEYDSLEEFREQFSRHLAQTVIREFTSELNTDVDMQIHSVPTLSSEARELLLEAANAPDGVVMMLDALSGIIIRTNKRKFGEYGDARSEAKWRRVVTELASGGYIEDRAGKGEVFFVTDQGYEAADSLGGENSV
jgi:nucleoside 2-deoxyribosyltransferase